MIDHKSLENAIIELLLQRGQGKTICPSEVVRRLYPDNWREKMDDVRQVARELVKKDKIEITQKGEVVDPLARGPIRLRLKSKI
jgi:hypothetical protein